MPGETLPNPDIMIRRRDGVIYFGPQTRLGEDWLATYLGDTRPRKDYDGEEIIGQQSFEVQEGLVASTVRAAEGAGLIVRAQRRR